MATSRSEGSLLLYISHPVVLKFSPLIQGSLSMGEGTEMSCVCFAISHSGQFRVSALADAHCYKHHWRLSIALFLNDGVFPSSNAKPGLGWAPCLRMSQGLLCTLVLVHDMCGGMYGEARDSRVQSVPSLLHMAPGTEHTASGWHTLHSSFLFSFFLVFRG